MQAKQFEDDVRRAHTLGQQETQAALARRLLAFCDSPLADERAKLMDAWTNRIGFQADNAANQLEHLSSLLVSEGASNGGDYERAIDSVHAKVIGPVERWRAHVGLGDRSGVVTHPARRKTPMARVYGGIDGSHTVERRNQVRAERRLDARRGRRGGGGRGEGGAPSAGAAAAACWSLLTGG